MKIFNSIIDKTTELLNKNLKTKMTKIISILNIDTKQIIYTKEIIVK